MVRKSGFVLGLKIHKLYAFVTVAPDGDEGIMAFQSDGIWHPMVGADMVRVEALRPIADATTAATGAKYEVREFALVGPIFRKYVHPA